MSFIQTIFLINFLDAHKVMKSPNYTRVVTKRLFQVHQVFLFNSLSDCSNIFKDEEKATLLMSTPGTWVL
jgi:hypothetical protein